MKILCAFHDITNPGGITNHQEHLTLGLRELGHTVEARLLVWKTSVGGARSSPSRGLKQERGALGMQLDQQVGWFWPPERRFAYKGKYNVGRWREYASRFDLIIWQIPTVTERGDQRGNSDWIGLYDVPVKQIAVIHDGNLVDAYPWIYAVADKLTALAGVHPCGYRMAKKVPLPCALIPNPHHGVLSRVDAADASEATRAGWTSIQTFKGWKRVADLVRAVPHMQGDYPKILGGGGIEYHYMTSKDKMKDAYVASRQRDPDLPVETEGRRIWDVAVESGMQYTGYLSNSERDAQLQLSKFLIDPSWNKKYAATGDHFNRTPIEGIISGCVPIARNLGVADNEAGVGTLFKPGENYVMIPWNAKPSVFADIVDEALNMPESQRLDMLAAGRSLLDMFESRRVAQWYVDLAEGLPAGLENCVGEETPSIRSASESAMSGFFAPK